MINRGNIAFIGLSRLESLGLKYLMNDSGSLSIEIFSDLSEFLTQQNNADAFIVSSDIFIENLDFFMPKRKKTLTVVSGLNKNSKALSSNIISPESDESMLKGKLEEFLHMLDEEEPLVKDLSSREIEVLKLIASGKINKEIADILFISINTVLTHRKNISAKLGIKSVQGLSLYAMMNGLLD